MKSLFTSSKKYVIIESPSKKLVYGTKRAARGDIMVKKEMIAMLLAGGQGSRLGVLTQKVAKPAVSFGGKYRIIDFPLSNCINSGVDTVGVLTQYQPLRLNAHIGIGIPWDLDRNVGGVTVLPPYERSKGSDWYTGTANAIYQNLEYMESYNPEYVLILSGDHIYKMDYEVMLEYHKANNADVTIAAMPVPIEEASRFGILITDDNNRITEFEEKPKNPRSNLASMGIYIFSWKALKEALIKLSEEPGCDFGNGSLHMSTMATGKMSEPSVPTGKQIWSSSILFRNSTCMRNTGRSTQRATVSRRSISLLTRRSQNVSSERVLRSTVR